MAAAYMSVSISVPMSMLCHLVRLMSSLQSNFLWSDCPAQVLALFFSFHILLYMVQIPVNVDHNDDILKRSVQQCGHVTVLQCTNIRIKDGQYTDDDDDDDSCSSSSSSSSSSSIK